MIAPGALISPSYRALQVELHARPQGYGGKGATWAPAVRALVQSTQASSVLDYGCGQGSLVKALNISGLRVAEYDPAIPGKDGPPTFADLVICTDVLEHIEPDRLDSVLAHLKLLARKAIFAVVSLKESNKVLADGRNAHLTVETAAWWTARLESAGFTVSAGPRSRPEALELSVILT